MAIPRKAPSKWVIEMCEQCVDNKRELGDKGVLYNCSKKIVEEKKQFIM